MKLFTAEEATGMLAQLEPMIGALQLEHSLLAEMQRAYADALEQTSSNGHSVAEKLSSQREAIKATVKKIKTGIAEIEALGCTVKDLAMGLLDFPGLREGRVVNLCWRLGEPAVAFWHSLDTGFGSRQPL